MFSMAMPVELAKSSMASAVAKALRAKPIKAAPARTVLSLLSPVFNTPVVLLSLLKLLLALSEPSSAVLANPLVACSALFRFAMYD